MNIDRSRFLLLATSLAASCTTQPTAVGPEERVPSETTPDESPAETDPQPLSEPQLSTREPDEKAPPVVSVTPAPPRPAPQPQAQPTQPQPQPAPAVCDNNVGSAASCSLKAPGPQCESFHDTVKECPVVRGALRPRVSERFMSCLNAKSGNQAICDFYSASTCMTQAVAQACIEPATANPCKQVVAQCGKSATPTLQRDCQALLSGVDAKHRQRLITSMSEGCNAQYAYFDLSMLAHGHP